jgi:hypothetical protein
MVSVVLLTYNKGAHRRRGSKHVKTNTLKELNKLPASVQEEVKKWLRVYNEASVVFEYGEYHTSAGIAIKSVYADDHKFIGTFNVKGVFTEDERMVNYMNSFREYPIHYKGKRDYIWLKAQARDTKFELDSNGNFKTAE